MDLKKVMSTLIYYQDVHTNILSARNKIILTLLIAAILWSVLASRTQPWAVPHLHCMGACVGVSFPHAGNFRLKVNTNKNIAKDFGPYYVQTKSQLNWLLDYLQWLDCY